MKRVGKFGFASSLKFRKMTKNCSHVTGSISRRHVCMDLLIKRDESNRVLLPIQQIRYRCGEELCILKFGDRASARVVHRGTSVDQQMALRIGVGAILLDEIAIGPTQKSPVKVSKIITLVVLAILGKLG